MRIILWILALTASADAATYYMWIGYGQSLSIGSQGTPPISTAQPYSNKSSNGSSLVALVNSTQESPSVPAANNITLLDPTHIYMSIWQDSGFGGAPLSDLSKGQTLYNNLISGVGTVKSIIGAGNTLIVVGIFFTHGEADALSQTYKTGVVQLQSDLEADIKPITGQVQSIPFFYSQVSGTLASPGFGTFPTGLYTCPDGTVACIDDPSGTAAAVGANAQWQLQRDYPGKFYLVGPKYQYTYADLQTHLTAQGYNLYGATAARALKEYAVDGNKRTIGAVMPRSISRVGTTVTAQFWTPDNLTLTVDGTVANPTRNGNTDTTGKGFQFFCDSGGTVTEIAVTGVSISTQTATLTLASAPSCSTSERLVYAFEGTRYADSGLASSGSAHGSVRTAADYTDLNGDVVYHWLIHFNEPVGFNWSPYSGFNGTILGNGRFGGTFK